MIDYTPLYKQCDALGLASFAEAVSRQVASRLDPASHGDLSRWYETLASLPIFPAKTPNLAIDCITIGPAVGPTEQANLADLLQNFHPWRKGPFCIHGVNVDTEWRSDWKWNRLKHAVDLRQKRVLDVGCGNGYYGWRMVGAGAKLVIGVDPTLLYVMQYAAVRHFIGPTPNFVLPLRLEDLPATQGAFDVVLSMGVLYHRRNPLAHLQLLRSHLKPGGQLILETLVVEGGRGEVLVPGERYAKMKNVWSIPTVPTTAQWLALAGFDHIGCIDVTPTSRDEQRTTPWMRFESLADFLDPSDAHKTREGHPAPVRAIFVARAGDGTTPPL